MIAWFKMWWYKRELRDIYRICPRHFQPLDTWVRDDRACYECLKEHKEYEDAEKRAVLERKEFLIKALGGKW